MKYRKLPFGYLMKQGRAVIKPKEAEIVTAIFQKYAAGSSYLDLVEMLKTQPIPYDTGRPWNKNIVARILEDSRYQGQMEYPAIIDEGLFLEISQKRSTKQLPPLTDTQKILRRLSGQKVDISIENEVKDLLNILIANPDNIQQTAEPTDHQSEIDKLETDLAALLDSQPINEDAIHQLIRQIAVARYDAIPFAEYETQRLRYFFTQADPMDELDAEFLKNTVSEIQIKNDGNISIHLKNGQSVERRISL